jgi:hypothetical protein
MEKLKVDTQHYFEIMDRTTVLLANLDAFLIQNPAAKAEPKISKKLEKIGHLLAQVYGEAGHIYFEKIGKDDK